MSHSIAPKSPPENRKLEFPPNFVSAKNSKGKKKTPEDNSGSQSVADRVAGWVGRERGVGRKIDIVSENGGEEGKRQVNIYSNYKPSIGIDGAGEISYGWAGMISLRHGFIFVHIPKTAGNSIQTVLAPYSEDRIETREGQDGVDRFRVVSEGRNLVKHSTLAEYYRELGAERAGGMFKFACVRNTWDRLVSFYFSPHRGEVKWSARKFRRFVEKEARPLREYFALGDEEQTGRSPFENIDQVIRFENLNEDFAAVCCRIGIPETELPVRNRSGRGKAAKYLDADLVEFVRERFADEIEWFGYMAPGDE